MLCDDTVAAIAQQMAHRVEWIAEISRQHGFAFPAEYDFGISAERELGGLRVSLRIGDSRTSYLLHEPTPCTEDAVDRFNSDMASAAGAIVYTYIEEHPELQPEQERAEKLFAEVQSQGAQDAIDLAARRVARTARYEPR